MPREGTSGRWMEHELTQADQPANYIIKNWMKSKMMGKSSD